MDLKELQNLIGKVRGLDKESKQIIGMFDLIAKYIDAKLETKMFYDSGVVATAPGTSTETDIEERQFAFNVPDKIGFMNLGGYINNWSLESTANFTIADHTPKIVDEQSVGNTIVVTGTGFDNTMTARIPNTGGMVFTNVSVVYNSETQITVMFDVAGDITGDQAFVIYVDKTGYELSLNMSTDVDLEIVSDNVGGEVGKSSSEIIRLTVNENIIAFTGANTDNVNVTVNSVTKISDTTVDVDLDTSAAAYEEAFSIRVIGDGETTSYYAMALEVALVISSMDSDFVPYNVSAGLPKIYLSKNISVLTSVESDNPNIVIDDDFPVIVDNTIDGILVDTTAASEGEIFNIRVIADGETTTYYSMSVVYSYVEFDEVGTHSGNVSGYSGITNWVKASVPSLFFETIGVNFYAYESVADRTTGVSASVFYVADSSTTVIEQNSSGYGGTLTVNELNVGDKMWCHAKAFVYNETNETGTPASNVGDDYYNITGWDKLDKTTLYLYYGDDVDLAGGYEVYDNITSRDARTSGDILALFTAPESITEQNSSGFSGVITNSNATDGDKFYVVAS